MGEKPLALVTGAGGGIGAAIVARLVEDGMRVLALDRDEQSLAPLADRDEVCATAFDLADLAETPGFLAKLVCEYGVPTRLALNAGVWPGAPIAEMSDEVWQINFAVNVTSPFAFMRGLAPQMAEAGGGKIVALKCLVDGVGGHLARFECQQHARGVDGVQKAKGIAHQHPAFAGYLGGAIGEIFGCFDGK